MQQHDIRVQYNQNQVLFSVALVLSAFTTISKATEQTTFELDKEYNIYEAFKLIISDHSIENFVIYLDQLVDLNSPKVVILVGSKHENYDHLSEYIETKYSDKIYRGIKIVYKNKVYDFSLSERNI